MSRAGKFLCRIGRHDWSLWCKCWPQCQRAICGRCKTVRER